MKSLNKLYIVTVASMSLLACDTDYINDPDNRETAPSTNLVNNAQFDLAFNLNDEWTAGRGTLGIAQYWSGTDYTEENRYQLRVNQINSLWNDPYRILNDLKKVIEINEDPETMVEMAQYGSNNNQIQATRIMMAYAFMKLVDTFGHVPYWSYGQKDNPDFQGLQLEDGIKSPSYVTDALIYEDMLKELKEAADNMELSEGVFDFSGGNKTRQENFCGNDAAAWVKFAHSLRLRLAVHIRNVNPSLAQTIYDESKDKTITSNDDNVFFTFGTDDLTGGPWHDAFTVGKRRDFAPSTSFMDLLYNKVGPFTSIASSDPRTEIYFEPRNGTSEIIGVPYGFGNTPSRLISDEGVPGENIIRPDYTQYIIEYAEIEFIKSEFEGWDQTHYENAVRASMEKWEVNDADITSYISALPAASEETVLTQKYIALYMDGLESWTEYRRTGYPNTLTVPGDTYDYIDNEGDSQTATFTTLIPGLDEIPSRVTYPQNEQLLNSSNWENARSLLSDGDVMYSKIFWDVE